MEDYEPGMSFDQDAAEIYDDELRGDEEATVAFLADLASGGPALELALGTGRIALPLAARDIRVDGIDISPAMVAKLRQKPGGAQLSVTMGNFADVPVRGSYRLIFVVFNTLFNLLTQDEQVRCFENVAAHLDDDGVVRGGGIRADVPHASAELDLIARIAGLRLINRWAGWNGEPFDTSSTRHVSVYRP